MPLYSNTEKSGAFAYSLAEYGAGYKLSEHLALGEFACKDGTDIVLVHPDFPEAFEATRASLSEHFGIDVPLFFNSGYRTVSYNDEEGGSEFSTHTYGMTGDMASPVALPREIARHAQPFFGGIGTYQTFCHCDVWKERKWTR